MSAFEREWRASSAVTLRGVSLHQCRYIASRSTVNSAPWVSFGSVQKWTPKYINPRGVYSRRLGDVRRAPISVNHELELRSSKVKSSTPSTPTSTLYCVAVASSVGVDTLFWDTDIHQDTCIKTHYSRTYSVTLNVYYTGQHQLTQQISGLLAILANSIAITLSAIHFPVCKCKTEWSNLKAGPARPTNLKSSPAKPKTGRPGRAGF